MTCNCQGAWFLWKMEMASSIFLHSTFHWVLSVSCQYSRHVANKSAGFNTLRQVQSTILIMQIPRLQRVSQALFALFSLVICSRGNTAWATVREREISCCWLCVCVRPTRFPPWIRALAPEAGNDCAISTFTQRARKDASGSLKVEQLDGDCRWLRLMRTAWQDSKSTGGN